MTNFKNNHTQFFIMHIGDGLLDLIILIPLWIIIVAYTAIILFKMRKSIKQEQIPIISVLTAVVFSFQMLNFPVFAGTSGHFLGFLLLAILTAPSIGFLMIMVILIIQAFIFADGGILALGANIFNMGIATLPGYFTYWAIRKKFSTKSIQSPEETNLENNDSIAYKTDRGLLLGSFIGAYISLITASFICGLEIGFSSLFPYPISITVPAMMGYHALIAIGEAMITTFVVMFFHKYAPEYIPDIRNLPIWS